MGPSTRQNFPALFLVMLWIIGGVAVAPADARQARVRASDPPYFVGLPVQIEVVAEGFTTDSPPVCSPPIPPPGVTLRFVGQSANSSVRIRINNRVQESSSSHTFIFVALAEKPGLVELGPFTVAQDQADTTTAALNLDFREVGINPDMRIVVETPPGPFYVGQRVPITIQWWYAGDIKSLHYEALSIRSPLFDLFTFEDTPPRDGNRLPLETEAGRIAINAEVTEQAFNGRKFLVVSAKRTMQIDRVVDGPPIPLHATALVITRWQRGFFGSSPAAFRPIRTEGKPVKITITPLPLDKAPPGFGGAVGHGFSISAEADRSVVQEGDPIKVTVTVRGDANMQHISLPPLDTEAAQPGTGISPQDFRFLETLPAGEVFAEGQAKRFEITLEPLDISITQIPPLLFAWFDPATRRFESAKSDPIALSVTAAKMIGVTDVVRQESSSSETPEQATAQADPQPAELSTAPPAREGRIDLSGADLSICKDPPTLLAHDDDRFGGTKVLVIVYGGSLLSVAIALWRRRKSRLDPRVVAMRKVARDQVRCIRRAARLPRQEAARQIAAALRRLAPMTQAGHRADIDRLVAACDVLAYARGEEDAPAFDQDMHANAMKIAHKVTVEHA